jgi:putative transposase
VTLTTPQLSRSAIRQTPLVVQSTGNSYAVDPALTGRRVELRYDPEDLTAIDVWLDGRPAGKAVPFITRRHVHRAVPQAARPEPAATGIDYLGLVAAAHDGEAGTGAKIDYARLAMLGGEQR